MPPQPPAPTLHTPALLHALLREALDPAYAEAAARRKAAPAESAGQVSRSRVIGIVGLAAVGILAAVAIGQQRAGAPDLARARTRLATEVTQRTQLVAFLTTQIETLRKQTSAARDNSLFLSQEGSSLAGLVKMLEEETGATPVSGAGLTVKLSDSSTPIAGGSTRDEGRIQDRDVQDVVNALWAAGAKAISVNGIRLTAQTAIRTAGEAILVDFRAQASPYVVAAIGDQTQLQVGFSESPVAQRFSTWTQLYGLGFSITRSKSISLAAAAPTAPRHAKPLAQVASKSASPSGLPSPSPSAP